MDLKVSWGILIDRRDSGDLSAHFWCDLIVETLVEDESSLGFDGGNGDEEDTGEWDKYPLDDEGTALPYADIGAFWKNLYSDNGRDENTDSGDIEHACGETWDVVGENGVAVVVVEELWEPAGEGEKNRSSCPVKVIKEERKNSVPTFEEWNVFVV